MDKNNQQNNQLLKLLIVIINYKTPEMTIECLKSLSNQVPFLERTHVIMVDNGSGDGSVEKIINTISEYNWQSWITVLPLEENLGFAGGNNRGLEAFPNVEYALLLNSDTIVHDNCLEYCLKVMDKEPTIGAMSCKLLNRDGSVQNAIRKFPNPYRSIISSLGLPWYFPKLFSWADIQDEGWDRETTKKDVDWLGGAFLLIRGEVLQKIGFLDEDFFFYGEDIEFNYRIYKAGYRRYYDPTVSITHFGGGSSEPDKIVEIRKKSLYWKGRYLVQLKSYGWWAATILRIVDLSMFWLRVMILGTIGKKQKKKYQESIAVWKMLSSHDVNF